MVTDLAPKAHCAGFELSLVHHGAVRRSQTAQPEASALRIMESHCLMPQGTEDPTPVAPRKPQTNIPLII